MVVIIIKFIIIEIFCQLTMRQTMKVFIQLNDLSLHYRIVSQSCNEKNGSFGQNKGIGLNQIWKNIKKPF